jgi:hypothetical protein
MRKYQCKEFGFRFDLRRLCEDRGKVLFEVNFEVFD